MLYRTFYFCFWRFSHQLALHYHWTLTFSLIIVINGFFCICVNWKIFNYIIIFVYLLLFRMKLLDCFKELDELWSLSLNFSSKLIWIPISLCWVHDLFLEFLLFEVTALPNVDPQTYIWESLSFDFRRRIFAIRDFSNRA